MPFIKSVSSHSAVAVSSRAESCFENELTRSEYRRSWFKDQSTFGQNIGLIVWWSIQKRPQDPQEFISYKDPPNFYQSKSESDQCIEAEVKSEVLYYP